MRPQQHRLQSNTASGKISNTMRAALISSFLVVSIVSIFGCASSSKKAEGAQAQATQKAVLDQRAEFKKRCGDPAHFPISEACVRLAGDRGPSLRHESDLTVAVWRACSLTPSSAETIRQELAAKGGVKTAVGQKMIGEMERTEQHSDSPCVVADLRDLDCVAGNSEACENARNADPACTAWLNDGDTQLRLHCIDRAVHYPACMAKQPPRAPRTTFPTARRRPKIAAASREPACTPSTSAPTPRMRWSPSSNRKNLSPEGRLNERQFAAPISIAIEATAVPHARSGNQSDRGRQRCGIRLCAHLAGRLAAGSPPLNLTKAI